ncbi:MAG: DNA-processing protein DprA [Treponema sp.]|nr:DNA-processing protein DprA [Treponema sp.]
MADETLISKISFFSRLVAQDASFLTCREKCAFYNFLLKKKDGSSFEDFSEFEKRLLSLTRDDISICVKRVLSRAKWTASESFKKAKTAQKLIEIQGIKSTCILDSDFPAMLTEMKDPPFILFYRGNLEILKRRCVSVVGTRRASPQALSASTEFSKSACDNGWCVVSGLAFGIDAASHKGALVSKNPATCAVLPGGIDTIAPSSHTKLAAKILESGGLIMSEYLPGVPAVQFRFVERNRIVAALSSVTLVAQAPCGSGAMITAGLALDYNREVVFHRECFSEQAKKLNEFSQNELKKQILQGKDVSYKLENSPQKYVDDGAKIISGYEDFAALFV